MKLARLLRLGRLSRKVSFLAEARALRIVVLLLGFTMFAHVIACGWFFLESELISVRPCWARVAIACECSKLMVSHVLLYVVP